MNKQELKGTLDSHSKWLQSEKDGMRADLKGAYLEGANLSCATYVLQWQAPQGVRRTCYSVKHDKCVMHKLGCFWGTTEQAIKAIRKKYGNDSMYEQLLFLNTQALEVE